MASKLPKGQYPAGHCPEDFECSGPPALKDGQFEATKIADLGCFTQDGRDTCKYYHAAVVKSKKTGDWYAYFEWGRTGSARPDCQFVLGPDEASAQAAYEKQLHSKNDKRGVWVKIAGIETLQAKPNKDCYLVRPLSTRSTGLPDAKTIQFSDAPAPQKKAPKKKKSKKKPSVDPRTQRLLNDLKIATIQYAKGAMADSSIPTQTAIEEARNILTEALVRLTKVGDDIHDQARDNELKQLTEVLYGRIPKTKRLGAPLEEWVLNKENIQGWNLDLDAFEQARVSSVRSEEEDEVSPLLGMDLEMSWINHSSPDWTWLRDFAMNSTRNKHGYIGRMRILNIWKIRKPKHESSFVKIQARIAAKKPVSREKPMFEPKGRPDLSAADQQVWKDSRTALLWHGTRSVNVSGILNKSLIFPKKLVGVAITGAMFGGGAYFADDWKKSAGYTSLQGAYWAGGSGNVSRRKAFMFLADVPLGKPYVAPGPRGYTAPPDGHDSVFGKAGKSHVMNNEWIVYEQAQHNLRYLVEFDA